MTTKEDQLRAEFEIEARKIYCGFSFEYDDVNGYKDESIDDAFIGYKACAESYEKKLAEKDVAMHHLVATYQVAEQKLSEANKRNAMLVEVVRACDRAFMSGYGASDCHDACVSVLAANSEAVAAWEAEKLEPLRREVAMLRDVLIRTAMDLKNSDNYDEALLDAAINNTQATAEAYEREVAAKVLDKFGKETLETVNHSDVDDHSFEDGKEATANDAINCAAELRAANKGKEIV